MGLPNQKTIVGFVSQKVRTQPIWMDLRASIQRALRKNASEKFVGTSEQWFEQDLAKLDREDPMWNRNTRIHRALAWLRDGESDHMVRVIFGPEIYAAAKDAQALENAGSKVAGK